MFIVCKRGNCLDAEQRVHLAAYSTEAQRQMFCRKKKYVKMDC